ncbi:GntR family transcriptional regulator [Paracidobacterium acidisoli]|uniref:GntR family transcriptional regulator n=1 Tax=Paracidobacterium acidisoli TaxID=2303751 RepID=A0A372IKE0_9BACT|nr:GntR family transcriptional regulator [Paracidobacterium acidisoli]MBT9332697.1 GntR family transcriptional regulator [Paracidobacterium acidisoli]
MQTIVERLYQKVRQDIVECELSPGAAFSEAELGRRYHASRTPVREVCRRLENDGLIRIIPFRGYAIAPLSVTEFHNLEELQMIFEPSAAAFAAERATSAELDEMDLLAEYEYQVGDRQSYRQFIRQNYQLHCLIARATRNQQLYDVVSNVHVRLMRFFYLGLPFDSYGPALVKEHVGLAAAIRARDPEMARLRATEHITNAMQRSASLLMSALRFGEAVFEPVRDEQRLSVSARLSVKP